MKKTLSYLKILILLLISTNFFFCETTYVPSGDSGQIEYIQGNTIGKVVLQLFDSHTLSMLDNVLVKIIGEDSVYTNSFGTAIFDSVRVGTYIVICTKSGYQSVISELVLGIDSNSNTVPVVQQSADILYLPRKGASISGTFLYQQNQSKYPAVGATVELSFNVKDIKFLEPIRVTTTTANGRYIFHNLPEYTDCKFTIKPFKVNGFAYKFNGSLPIVTEGVADTVQIQSLVLNPIANDNFIIMSHNLTTLKNTDSIAIRFSEPVNISQLNGDSIFINRGSMKILTTIKWLENNTLLTIKPYDALWLTNYTYYLTIKKLKSKNNKILNNGGFVNLRFQPGIIGQLGNVSDIKYIDQGTGDSIIDSKTTSVKFLWSKLSNAQKYEIYLKTATDSNWIFARNTAELFVTVTTKEFFIDNKTAQFLILGKNPGSISSFATATKLLLKDKKRPIIYDNNQSSYGFQNNTALPKKVEISVPSYSFSEPMDTTQNPTIKIYEGANNENSGDENYKVSPGDCIWTWQSNRTAIIEVTVAASKNAAYDKIQVDCRMLKDVAGNAVITTDLSNQKGFIVYNTRP